MFLQNFILIYIFLVAIFFQKLEAQTPNVGKWRAGSANILEGNVYNICIFVSEKNGEHWTKAQKTEVLKKVTESQNWLVKQAKSYNVKLSFQTGNFGFDNDILFDEVTRGTGSGNENVDWGSKTFKKIGYKSSYAFYQWVLKNTKCKNTHYIIFVKGAGRGYAMPASTEMSQELYFMEGAVLYEKYSENSPLQSSAISHETLHVYSAWDLYKTFSQTKENEEKARKIYPNSVMLRTSYNHNDLEVDELSAWLIGWNKKPKNSFESFRPKDTPIR